jgi:hypothetical protein
MRILLLSPLYPPDIAPPAPYVKELLKRLGPEASLLTYGRLPEPVEGVQITAVDKRRSLVPRLFAYTRTLMRRAKNADVLYAQNGASVELPLLLASLVRRTPVVFAISDASAHARAGKSFLLRTLEKYVQARAKITIADFPPKRPIILPLEPRPEKELAEYDAAWNTHVAHLKEIFSKATT